MGSIGILLGLFTVVVGLCGVESDINIQNEQEMCMSLCSELSDDSPEDNLKTMVEKQIFPDSLVKKNCDCSKLRKSDFRRRRRSIATSKPQPTMTLGNQSNNTQNNITVKGTETPDQIPGYNPAKHIKFMKPSPYCNYSVGEKDQNKKGKIIKNAKVAFEDHGQWSFNVTWEPPEDAHDDVFDYLVMWNGQRKPSDPPNIEHNYIHCRKVPKNQTGTIIMENDGWKYPQTVYLAVVTIPQNFYTKSIDLQVFSPIGRPKIIPVPPRNKQKDVTLQNGSIVGGVIVGVLCILVLFVLVYRKKCGSSESPDNEVEITIPFANNTDGLPKILNVSKPKNVDIYFGSYLPESEKYSNAVATIAGMLRASGYRVIFDQVDSVELNSMGFNMWVEKQILEARKYIVFASPGYIKLWQSLATNAPDDKLHHVNKEDQVRVRYEIKRITDIYSETCSTSKIICIKMDPKMSSKSLPPWMNHNMLLWPEQKFDILRRLNDQADMVMA